jgi:bacterioferritin-associated ferredoxin
MVVFYHVERESLSTFVVDVPRATPFCDTVSAGETIVCHCLQVTQSSVVEAVRDGGARSLCELARLTGAGSGCTSCHRRLRAYLNDRRESAQRPLQNAEIGHSVLGNAMSCGD